MPDVAVAAQPVAAPVIQMSKYRLKESRFQIDSAGYRNTVWAAYIEDGHSFDEVMKPEYWAHVAGHKNVKIGDRILVRPDDGSYFAELYVRDVGAAWAKVAVTSLHKWEVQTEAGEVEGDDFEIQFKGPLLLHVVTRKRDGVRLKDTLRTRQEAADWLREHRKALRA